MSVVMRHHVPGLTEELYWGISAQVTDTIKASRGFIAHYAILEGDGLTVTEIWDSQADFEAFFKEHVLPKLPEGTPAPTFFEIIDTITP